MDSLSVDNLQVYLENTILPALQKDIQQYDAARVETLLPVGSQSQGHEAI